MEFSIQTVNRVNATFFKSTLLNKKPLKRIGKTCEIVSSRQFAFKTNGLYI